MLLVFIKRAPFVRFVIPFIIGIYLFNEGASSILNLALLLGVVVLYVLFCIWFKSKAAFHLRCLHGFFVFTILFLSGYVYHQSRLSQLIKSNEQVSAKIQVIQGVGDTEKSQRYLARLLSTDRDTFRIFAKSKGLIYIPVSIIDESIHPGQYLLIQGRFINYSKPAIPYSFDYSSYLKNRRWQFGIVVSAIKEIQETERYFDPIIQSARVREFLQGKFEQYGVGLNELAVLNALFLGDKSDLDYELKQKYSSSGALHLLAVSGLHVGIIYLIINGFFGLFLKKYRRVLALCLILCLWFYALITGLSPSVLRATIMFSILEMGRLFGRKTNVYNLLGASAFLILLIDPLTIYNVGFWLSHCAVASIVAFYSTINNWVYFHFPPFRWAWSITALSLSAQIGAAPISVMVFHQFPIYFPISNLLLIPAVTFVLVMAVVGAIFCWSDLIMTFISGGLNDLLMYMNSVVAWIDGLPYALLSRINLEVIHLVLFFLFFIVVYFYLQSYRMKLVFYSLGIFITLLFAIQISRAYQPLSGILISEYKSGLLINYFNNDVNEVYTEKPLRDGEINFLFNAFWTKQGVLHGHKSYFNKHVIDSLLTLKFVGKKSYLIVRKCPVWTPKKLDTCIDYAIIINGNQCLSDSVYENVAHKTIDPNSLDEIFYHYK